MISPSNTLIAGPVIDTGNPSPSQLTVSKPPRVATFTGLSSKVAAYAGDDRGTGTRSARQRFARTAFIYTQPQGMAIHDLHESRVDVLGKTRMMFDQPTQLFNRRMLDIINELNGMGIAHRQRADLKYLSADFQRFADRTAAALEREQAPDQKSAGPC